MPSDCWKTPTGQDATVYKARQDERTAWFNKIAPSPNWKTRIDCIINVEDFDDCAEACVYFTGSVLTKVATFLPERRVRVQAAGYYATIGA